MWFMDTIFTVPTHRGVPLTRLNTPYHPQALQFTMMSNKAVKADIIFFFFTQLTEILHKKTYRL